MRYFFAIICPPLAVLTTGRPIATFLNLVLCVGFVLLAMLSGVLFIFIMPLGWLLCAIHAMMMVSSYQNDQRTRQIIAATRTATAVPRGPRVLHVGPVPKRRP
jgi:uncharacterized membrane protein YciS (DUF1049 family)